MTTTLARSLAVAFAVALAGAAALAPDAARAAGGQAFASGRHVGGGGNWHGGGGRGDHWGHRGYGRPGVFWGGVGLGLGFGAIGYYGGAWGPYGYAPYGWYDGGYWYDAPTVIVDSGPLVVDPASRAGQAVPQASRSPDPIFYPNKGQSAAAAESDRRDCNRWATTQNGAMADASIFQRATLACMEGRGYTVK